MKRLAILAAVLMSWVSLCAQTVTVTSSHFANAQGAPISGTIYFYPQTTAGVATAYRRSDGTALSNAPISATVTSGAMSVALPDTTITNPANICFQITYPAGTLPVGYGCIQPHAVAYNSSDWCQSGTCNLDAYLPGSQNTPTQSSIGQINSAVGDLTFTGPGVSQSGNTFTFSGSGGGVNPGTEGQIAAYAANGSVVSGISTVDATRIGADFDCLAYGADPTGVTDSTAAIQSCINAAAGSPVVLPAGKFLISAPLMLYSIPPTGGGYSAGCKISGAGQYKTQLVLSRSFTVPQTVTFAGQTVMVQPAAIDCQGTVSSTYENQFASGAWVQSMEIAPLGCENNPAVGEPSCINTSLPWNPAYTGPTPPSWIGGLDQVGIAGVSIEGTWHMDVSQLYIHNMSGSAIQIPDTFYLGGTGDATQSYDVYIRQNHLEFNGGWGVYLSNPTSGDLVDTNLIEFNALGGVTIGSLAQTITHNSIASNGCGLATSGTSSQSVYCTTSPLGPGIQIKRKPYGGGPYNDLIRENNCDSNAAGCFELQTGNNITINHNTSFHHASSYIYNTTFPNPLPGISFWQQVPKASFIYGEVAATNITESNNLDRDDFGCVNLTTLPVSCGPNPLGDPSVVGTNINLENASSIYSIQDFYRGNIESSNYSDFSEGGGAVLGLPVMSGTALASWPVVNPGHGYVTSPSITVVGGDSAYQSASAPEPTVISLTYSGGAITGCSIPSGGGGGPYNRAPMVLVQDMGLGSPGTGAVLSLTTTGSAPNITVSGCSVTSGGSGYVRPVAGTAPQCATPPVVTGTNSVGIAGFELSSAGNYGAWTAGGTPPTVTATVTDSGSGTGFSVTPIVGPVYNGSSIVWGVIDLLIPDNGRGYNAASTSSMSITFSATGGQTAARGTIQGGYLLNPSLTVTSGGTCDSGATVWAVVNNQFYPSTNSASNTVIEQNATLSSGSYLSSNPIQIGVNEFYTASSGTTRLVQGTGASLSTGPAALQINHDINGGNQSFVTLDTVNYPGSAALYTATGGTGETGMNLLLWAGTGKALDFGSNGSVEWAVDASTSALEPLSNGYSIGSTTHPVSSLILGSGSGDYATASGTFTAARTVTFPDANTNTLQPLSSAPSGGCVAYVDSSGVQHGATCGPTASGVATLVSGTATVSNAAACAVGSSCHYTFTNCGPNSSTAIGVSALGAVTAGTSFVINSLAAANTVATGDASTICWRIN